MNDENPFRALDRALLAGEARLTAGLSPAALSSAYWDWAAQLAQQPSRQLALAQRAWRDGLALAREMVKMPQEAALTPAADDHRFADAGWQEYPFCLYQQALLRAERWWMQATTGVPGVSRSHERMVSFMARQILDMLAPNNIPLLNPEVITATQASQGENLRRGWRYFLDDLALAQRSAPPPLRMRPGREVAVTPGKVVLRNALIELIQYTPAAAKVRPEPVLIVPAWIMKYYILDLSPQNSMVKFLVEQGFTVFMISWVNPSEQQREVSLEDYRLQGVMAALRAVEAICGAPKIHAAGYCLGGTLLTIAAAAMARDGDARLASLTLLAAQTDFTEAGELQLFINEAQLAFLDNVMWQQGYLDTQQMAGAFSLLRSNDLIWSRRVRRYFLGEQDHPNDMMSWNQDATRMPYRMHSQYLWHLFQNNDLAEGRYPAGGRPVSAGDIAVPIFAVGTETDHIAPWRSVYKIHLLNHGEITFVLTSGGHNAGVVSEPGHPHRHCCWARRLAGGRFQAPEEWQAAARREDGSWWPGWAAWLAAHSGPLAPPPPLGAAQAGYAPLCSAPGTYVLQR